MTAFMASGSLLYIISVGLVRAINAFFFFAERD